MVLEHVVGGVVPVVRYLTGIVVTHDVRRALRGTHRIHRASTGPSPGLLAGDEPVHLPTGGVGRGVRGGVRTAQVLVGGRVVWADHATVLGVADTDNRHTVLARDTVSPRIGAEVLIEGPVLLHDHDDVPDLGDVARARRSGLPARHRTTGRS